MVNYNWYISENYTATLRTKEEKEEWEEQT